MQIIDSPAPVRNPAPAPERAPFAILHTKTYARRLYPQTSDYSYSLGIVTTYRASDGREARIAHVGIASTYGNAAQRAGSDRYCWMQAMKAAR